MPATLTLTADSSRVPSLDGFVTTAGALDTAGDLTFQRAAAAATTVWITFQDVPLEKFRRFGPAFDRFRQSWPEDPGVVLRLTPTGAPTSETPVDLVVTIRAILEQSPAAIASAADLAGRTLTRQSVVWTIGEPAEGEETDPITSPDLTPLLNEVLENFPADGRNRAFTLVLSVAASADQSLSVKSGEGADAPQLDVVFQSILNQWRGDAEEVAGQLKITVLEAVPYALYSIDFGAAQIVSYRAGTSDTVSDIAAQLAALLGDIFTVEYEDETDTIIVTSNDPGMPFDFEFPRVPKSIVETVREGRRPISQQTRITLPAAVTGGTWAVTFDFGEGDETLATVSATASAATLQTAIEGLATPVPGDIEVAVENVLPRTYLITFKGNLAGLPVTVTADGSNLIGCATATVETIQRPGREIHDVFLYWFEQTQIFAPWSRRFTGFTFPPYSQAVGIFLTPLGLDAGSAAWTAEFERVYGEGNVRVTTHTSLGAANNLGVLMIEFMGDEAGIDHGEIKLYEGNSFPDVLPYTFQKHRLQNGAGSISNEFALLANTVPYTNVGEISRPDFTLHFDAETSASIAAENTLEIEPALVGLTAITLSDVDVLIPFGATDENNKTAAGLAVVKFQGAFNNVNVADLQPDTTPAGFDEDSQHVNAAVASNEIQVYFTDLSIDDLTSGSVGVNWDWDDTESELQAKFDAAFGSGNTKIYLYGVSVSTFTRAVVVRFQGTLAGTSQPLLTGFKGPAYRVQDRTDPGLQWQIVDIQNVPFRDWNNYERTGFVLTMDGEDTELMRFWDPADIEAKTGAARAWLSVNHERHLLLLGFAAAESLVVPKLQNTVACSIVQGSPLLNEIQRVVIAADGGTFRVKHDAEAYSSATAWPASTSDWQTALDATAGAGNTVATGLGSAGSPLSVEFIGDFEAAEVPLLTIDTTALTGNAPIAIVQARGPVIGLNEIQRVIVDPNATAGSIRLALDGRFSGAIAWNETAGNVETALDGTPGIGASNTAVEGVAGSPWLITFIGDLGNQPIALLTIDQDNLIVSGVGVLAVDVLIEGQGPNHWATPANWTLGRIPHTHDVVDLGPGRSDILAGLVQRIPVLVVIPDGDTSVDVLATDGLADFVDGQILRLHSTSGLFPSAEVGGDAVTLDAETDLYVLSASRIDRTLQLGLARDGAPIDWLDQPNGTISLHVCLQQLRHQMAYTGKVGLPVRGDDGRFEEKPQSLRIGYLPSRLDQPNLVLGIGDGAGSNRINLDAGPSPLKAEIVNSGGPIGDWPPILIDGTSDENEFLQVQGETGLSVLSGTSTHFRRIQLIAGRLSVGNDVQAAEGAEIDVYSGGQFLAGDLVTRRCNIRIRGQ